MTQDRGSNADILRHARLEESDVVADLWLRSRKASFPANPPTIHTDEEVRAHFATVVMPEEEVWVIDRVGKGIVAMIAIKDGWIEHLHVDPELTGRGLGTQLLDFAREWCVDGLDLWTFQSNAGARRFYERRGFIAVEMTDDANEERAPDVHYHWTP